AGGFGAVYKARLGRAVCTVKMVPRGLLPDVEHAIVDKEVATMVNHPCLVRYHATFATTEAFVTVMEYIRGVDVIRLLHLSTRLSDMLVRLILAQLALALCHMHYKGFLHRDIKPSNMMITVGCRVKLIDFDTAKVCFGKYTNRAIRSFYTRTPGEFSDGEIAGTVSYMAPEMLQYKEYGRSVDWWSFGVTAYELAVGKRPFFVNDSMDFDEQKKRVCRAQYQWPQGFFLSKTFKKLVRGCLQKQLSQRFCAEKYTDFSKHPFFAELDMRWVETSPEILKFDPLASVNAATLTYEMRPGCDSPEATPTAAEKCMRLFPRPSFTDTESQVKIFTYSSTGFRDAIRMITNGEIPTEQVIHTVPELVDLNEESGKFFFSDEQVKGQA
ncbi:microtubule-associated serine/threonine-protein kinase 3-like, partial [Tropilaelaps mercedesae]